MFQAIVAAAIRANGPTRKKSLRHLLIDAQSHRDDAKSATHRGHDYDLLRCDGAVDDFLFDLLVHPTL
jgi:hypothetical protein